MSIKWVYTLALLPTFVLAGEDITDPEPAKVEKSKDIYAIGALGSGRSDGENSVSVGAGVGMTLSEAERATLFAELTANHYGSYHSDATRCGYVSVVGGWGYGKRNPQTVNVCDQSTVSQDYVGALGELKLNWTQPKIQPFATAGLGVGDLDGFVWGLGLQYGPFRVHYRDVDDVDLLQFSIEIR